MVAGEGADAAAVNHGAGVAWLAVIDYVDARQFTGSADIAGVTRGAGGNYKTVTIGISASPSIR